MDCRNILKATGNMSIKHSLGQAKNKMSIPNYNKRYKQQWYIFNILFW